MKVNVTMEIVPFNVPDTVRIVGPSKKKQDGFTADTYTLSIRDLEPNDLDELCRQFRNAVFEKAGKQQPPVAA